MSVWRRKALAIMPEKRIDLEQKSISIYDVFMSLLSATRRAHQENDRSKLMSYYAFAEWCHNQNAKDLRNAAGVLFYEHPEDDDDTLVTMHKWVKEHLFTGQGAIDSKAGYRQNEATGPVLRYGLMDTMYGNQGVPTGFFRL